MMLTTTCLSKKRTIGHFGTPSIASTTSTTLAWPNGCKDIFSWNSEGLPPIYTRLVVTLCQFREIYQSSQKNSRWEESISLSKQDKLYKDAMVTASVSASTEVAEELLSYFVVIGNKECFAAMPYVCFDLLRSDGVEELSWQHGLHGSYRHVKLPLG